MPNGIMLTSWRRHETVPVFLRCTVIRSTRAAAGKKYPDVPHD